MAEKGHRAQRSASRQGRGKRRRRNEAGAEPRDGAAAEARDGVIRSVVRRPSGSGFSELGAPEGWSIPREQGRGSGRLVVRPAAEADGDAVEVLEGARKARSGDEPYGKLHGRPPAGRRQGPRRKAQGRRWSREAERTATAGGQTLKVDETPRRVRPRGRREAATGPWTGSQDATEPRSANADLNTPKGISGTRLDRKSVV